MNARKIGTLVFIIGICSLVLINYMSREEPRQESVDKTDINTNQQNQDPKVEDYAHSQQNEESMNQIKIDMDRLQQLTTTLVSHGWRQVDINSAEVKAIVLKSPKGSELAFEEQNNEIVTVVLTFPNIEGSIEDEASIVSAILANEPEYDKGVGWFFAEWKKHIAGDPSKEVSEMTVGDKTMHFGLLDTNWFLLVITQNKE